MKIFALLRGGFISTRPEIIPIEPDPGNAGAGKREEKLWFLPGFFCGQWSKVNGE
jgi:hypothetical protein